MSSWRLLPYFHAVGKRVAEIADIAIFVGNKFKNYQPGARHGGMGPQQMKHAYNVREAIDILQNEIRFGDVVLVKGREKQRLTRIVLALAGQEISCGVELCPLHLIFCDHCPLLKQNWSDA